MEEKNGEPVPVSITCTEDNVHTIIHSGMLTSGYVSMDTLILSGFGISVPAKVQLLIIKPAQAVAPEPESFMTREEMLAMVGDESTNEKEEKEEESDELTNEKEEKEEESDEEDCDKNTKATAEQLEALRNLAGSDE